MATVYLLSSFFSFFEPFIYSEYSTAIEKCECTDTFYGERAGYTGRTIRSAVSKGFTVWRGWKWCLRLPLDGMLSNNRFCSCPLHATTVLFYNRTGRRRQFLRKWFVQYKTTQIKSNQIIPCCWNRTYGPLFEKLIFFFSLGLFHVVNPLGKELNGSGQGKVVKRGLHFKSWKFW